MTTIYETKQTRKDGEKEYILVELRGSSTDTKPIQLEGKYIDNGSVYIEIGTGKIFFYDLDSETWKEA